jgi:hypothetical protein
MNGKHVFSVHFGRLEEHENGNEKECISVHISEEE